MNLQGQDYKQLLTDVIKKQIVILGPDITLAKARNVPGLEVADDGSVLSVSGNPQEITQKLIDQFVQLSGLIVKKTMEPLLTINQAVTTQTVSTPQVNPTVVPTPQVAPTPPPPESTPPIQPQTPEAPAYPLTNNPIPSTTAQTPVDSQKAA